MLRQRSKWDEGRSWQVTRFGEQWLQYRVARQNRKRTPGVNQWARYGRTAREVAAAFDEAPPHDIAVIIFLAETRKMMVLLLTDDASVE
jgi:hypothetical protein